MKVLIVLLKNLTSSLTIATIDPIKWSQRSSGTVTTTMPMTTTLTVMMTMVGCVCRISAAEPIGDCRPVRRSDEVFTIVRLWASFGDVRRTMCCHQCAERDAYLRLSAAIFGSIAAAASREKQTHLRHRRLPRTSVTHISISSILLLLFLANKVPGRFAVSVSRTDTVSELCKALSLMCCVDESRLHVVEV